MLPEVVVAGDRSGTGLGTDSGRMACHDLRQSIAAILLLCGEIPSGADPSVRVRVREIESQARFMSELVDDVLDRRTAADPADEETADLDGVVDAATAVAGLTYRGHLVRVADATHGTVRMNGIALRRVVANVVDNATRAAGPQGMVRVSTRVTPSLAVIEVEDSGPGWAQIESGHGLGLTFVSETVARHGGWVTHRRTRARRTRIRIGLPLTSVGR